MSRTLNIKESTKRLNEISSSIKDCSLDEFATKVKETHRGNEHERDYLAMVEFAKIKFSEN